MRIVLILGVFSTIWGINAQLFPFTNLKHLVEYKLEERPTTEPTVPSFSVNVNSTVKYQEQNKEQSLGTTVRDPTLITAEERTVIVTPKPKYSPQRLVPEPKLDPNSDLVPSMGYKPASQPVPVRSLTINPSEPPQKAHEPVRFSTVVESVPSLSVTIQDDSAYKRKKVPEGIVDYLVPPKYPSVYETMGLLSTPGSNLIDSEDRPVTQKTQKRKKNRNKASNYSPFKDNEDDTEKASSDKAKIRTVRPKRPGPIHVPSLPNRVVASPPPRKKSTRPPRDDETDNESSASDFHYKPRPEYSPNHFEIPFEEHEVAQNSYGLGGATGERVEFQMHGQNGPESYKFGFDTGEGKNRHFRYEEKDGHGNVKGHYGYYDRSGKLQIVNYHADEHGFHANAA